MKAVKTAAAGRAVRAQYPGQPLAARYDPLTRPPARAPAPAVPHRALDKCCHPPAFATELARRAFLCNDYQARATPLLPVARQARKERAGAGCCFLVPATACCVAGSK